MTELRARFSFLDRLFNGFGLYDSLHRTLAHLPSRFPRSWLIITIIVAGIGSAFILLFPYLVVSVSRNIYPALISARSLQDWLVLGSQICALFIGTVFTYTLFTMRFTPPAGKALTEQESPRLFALLGELRKDYGRPRIHRVILDEGDDVRIVKTPRTGFPFLYTTTLVIGLPLLLTVSPQHFRVLLARRIGQLSGRHNLVSGWLFHLKAVWLQYRDKRCSNSLPSRMIGYFFSLYAPVYNTVALGILRGEEFNADRYAHSIINDQEIVAAISFHAASREFLASKYWPTIRRMAARAGGKPDYLPYDHMTTVARKSLTTAALKTAIPRLLNDEDYRSDYPPLGDRLENLGHSGPIPMQELTATAAELLPEGSLSAVVQEFHKQWLDRFA